MADVEGSKRLGEELSREWFRLMALAKTRAERKAIQERFRKVVADLKAVYEPGAKEDPWTSLIRRLPPPLPIDPLGTALYGQLQKSVQGGGPEGTCDLCAAMDWLDKLEDECKNSPQPGQCVAEGVMVMERLLLRVVAQDAWEAELKAFCIRHNIPLG